MSTLTTNYSLIKPGVNDATDQDLWGGYLNSNFDAIDTLLKTATDSLSRSISGNGPITLADQNMVLLVDATGGNIALSLDDASITGNGFRFAVKKIDATTNTVTITSPDTIDGAVSLVIGAQNESYIINSNGAAYYIIANKSVTEFADNTASNLGTADDLALTPANFGTQKTHSANGYQKLPGGLIIQWGFVDLPVETVGQETIVTFPLEFPTSSYSITTSSAISTNADNHNFAHIIGTPSKTSFVLKNQYVSGENVPITVRWMALGV